MPPLKPIRGLQIQRGNRLARGLVGCWLMNEGAGVTVFDYSGHSHPGAITGTVPWVGGKFGSSLDFPGANTDYVTIGTGSDFWDLFVNGGTIVAWINVDTLADNRVIAGRWDTAGDNRFFLFWIYTDGDLVFALDYDGTASTAVDLHNNDKSVVVGAWTQVVAVYDKAGGQVLLYQDGILLDSAAYVGGIDSAAWKDPENTFTGMHDDGAGRYPLDGRIDNLLFYNRALSASEIALLYRKPFYMFERRIVLAEAVAVPEEPGSSSCVIHGWLEVA